MSQEPQKESISEGTIAVAHKDYDVRGGGEILAEHLARGLDAPLIVGHGDESHQPVGSELAIEELAPRSPWHHLAARGGAPRSLAHMMLWRDHAPDALAAYDTVVTSGNETQWWMPAEGQTWVAYCHSTPRLMYDRYQDNQGWIARTTTQLQRWVYQQELQTGADLWVANSDVVARRMRRYWGIDEQDLRVVYPPIETDKLSPDLEQTGDYYISLSRLSENKRVGEAIRAANERGFDLKVLGTGPEEKELAELAGSTVDMLGWVEGETKCQLLSGARALISCCRNEDFGMAVVEAIASGTPVITVDEGMPAYTVADGERGITYERGRLWHAIERFETHGVSLSEQELAEWASANFGVDRFIAKMQNAIEDARERTRVKPQFKD
jgi:glycosyltransferase involved in cell wall biosynthesis